MKRLLWINACMRGEGVSRTDKLCRTFLDAWQQANPDGEILERDLTAGNLPQLTGELAEQRDKAVQDGVQDTFLLMAARELAGADAIVIGAPYWDLSFPAVLKVYLEWASTLGVTFRYTEDGMSQGLCRAEHLLYITTAGGPVQGQNFGYDYVKALSTMLGIEQTQCVVAELLDVEGGPGVENMKLAEEELKRLAASW